MCVSLIDGHIDRDMAIKTESECRELITKEYPDYYIARVEEDDDYYEVCISKINGWTVRVLLVKKINGFIRELGV